MRVGCGHSLLSARAGEAFGNRWVGSETRGFKRFPAIRAIAEFGCFDPRQGCVYPNPLRRAAGRLSFCHRLILQSVHARETPNRLLIQLHCFSGVLTALILLVQFHETGQERTAVLIKLCVGHFDF